MARQGNTPRSSQSILVELHRFDDLFADGLADASEVRPARHSSGNGADGVSRAGCR
jgi:hypothetical protein